MWSPTPAKYPTPIVRDLWRDTPTERMDATL